MPHFMDKPTSMDNQHLWINQQGGMSQQVLDNPDSTFGGQNREWGNIKQANKTASKPSKKESIGEPEFGLPNT